MYNMYIFIFLISTVIGEKQACCFGDYETSWSSCNKSCGGGQRWRRKELLTAAGNFLSAAGAWFSGDCPEYDAPCTKHQTEYEGCNDMRCRELKTSLK